MTNKVKEKAISEIKDNLFKQFKEISIKYSDSPFLVDVLKSAALAQAQTMINAIISSRFKNTTDDTNKTIEVTIKGGEHSETYDLSEEINKSITGNITLE